MPAYTMPGYVINALEDLFSESVSQVRVIEHSWYAVLHGKILATTRRELILLNMGGDAFSQLPELVLHEYYHVVKQWRNGELSALKYVIESAKNGYINNKYEVATNRYVQQNISRFKHLLSEYKNSNKAHD